MTAPSRDTVLESYKNAVTFFRDRCNFLTDMNRQTQQKIYGKDRYIQQQKNQLKEKQLEIDELKIKLQQRDAELQNREAQIFVLETDMRRSKNPNHVWGEWSGLSVYPVSIEDRWLPNELKY